jgi:hypothetical protein
VFKYFSVTSDEIANALDDAAIVIVAVAVCPDCDAVTEHVPIVVYESRFDPVAIEQPAELSLVDTVYETGAPVSAPPTIERASC